MVLMSIGASPVRAASRYMAAQHSYRSLTATVHLAISPRAFMQVEMACAGVSLVRGAERGTFSAAVAVLGAALVCVQEVAHCTVGVAEYVDYEVNE